MKPFQVITICTSYKFKDDILDVYKHLTEQGFIVLLPSFTCTEHDKEWYMQLHKQRIAMSDAIVVIRADEYYGEAVTEEINYARAFGEKVYGISYKKYEGCLYYYDMFEQERENGTI